MKNKNKSVRMEGIKFYHTHKITKIGKQRLKKQKKKKHMVTDIRLFVVVG